MSKNKQNPEFEIRSSSAYKHKSRGSIDYKRIPIPQKPQKDSPYTQTPLPKTRSISTLNTKSTHKLRSISPTQTKPLVSHNHDLVPTFSQRSIPDSHRSLPKDNPKVPLSFKLQKSLISSSALEERLIALAKLPIKSSIPEYFQAFEDLIEQDSLFKKPLTLIKQAFYEWEIIKKKSLEGVKSLRKQLIDANKKIAVLEEDRKFLDRRMTQISEENLDLVKSLEASEAAYEEIERRLMVITDFRVENLEKNEDTWKALVLENNAFVEVVKKMEAELKSCKGKQSKLLKLIVAIKNKGFPVEDLYNKEVLGAPESVTNSESDRIVSGRDLPREKPGIVPNLPIDRIEAEVFTSPDFSSLGGFSF